MSGTMPPRSIPSEASTRHFHPVLRPGLQGMYAARAQRLRTLAEGHDLADYLRLAACVAEAQAGILAAGDVAGVAGVADAGADAAAMAGTEARANPAAGEVAEAAPAVGGPATHVSLVIDPAGLVSGTRWRACLDALVEALSPTAPAAVAPHLAALRAMSDAARIDAGQALVEGRFDAVPTAIAPLLWAALSMDAALAARTAPLPAANAGESADCPVCGSAPVASLIHTGERQGLRYLHCPLCECEWHVVRAKCTNCGDAGQLDYLSFDTPEAVVRAESCGHCGGYLKVVSQERDPAAEVVADDLATLTLDDAAASEGYGRTGFNPFALPA